VRARDSSLIVAITFVRPRLRFSSERSGAPVIIKASRMIPFDFELRTRVVFGDGALDRLPSLARELRFSRTLIVADNGIVAAGMADRVARLLRDAGITPSFFHEFDANPDSAMVEAGRAVAAGANADSIVAIGGGSSLDCAKGINFVLTNGGTMKDYWGHGKATKAMLPTIGVPTTAGTGSEAQQYAIISDPETHVKMACGDEKAAFRVAILDPALTVSQPRALTAVSGYDAISHAVESFVTAKRTAISDLFARDAWRRLEASYERVLEAPDDIEARAAMLLGSHEAGIAIEQSMLGATHACANPLTARYGTTHGVAIALMLPHVVRWNAEVVGDRYAELLRASGHEPGGSPGAVLAKRLEALARAGALPPTLREAGVTQDALPALSEAAAKQWTGTFNPRPFDAASAKALYQSAF
jgi:alcohol dehydrogenase